MDNIAARTNKIFHTLSDPAVWLLLLGFGLLFWHVQVQPNDHKSVKAELLYRYSLNIFFESGDNEVSVRTYLPENNERQRVIEESIQSDSMNLDNDIIASGRQAIWKGKSNNPIRYSALISNQEEFEGPLFY